jgi:cell division protein FtsW
MASLARLDRACLWLLGCVAGLATIGLVTAVSAAPPGEAWTTLARHCLFLGLGAAAFLLTFSLSPERMRDLVGPAMAVLFVFLCLMLVTGLGRTANSATRWVQVGPMTLQPSIFFQCLWPVAIASWVSRDPLRLRDPRQLVRIGALFLLVMLPVLLQPDLGSVVILLVVTGCTFLFAGAPSRILVILLPVMAGLVVLAALVFPHVASRLTWWQETPTQVERGHDAMMVGGVSGLGPGNGLLKMGKVPEGETDFVLPLVAEEWGLFGTLTVWTLYVAFTFLGMRAAKRSRSRYGIILMVAATLMISFQAAYNMAMICGLVPVKGLPLPFISRGGSSILALSALLGVSLKAASEERRAAPPVTELFA